MIPQLRTLGLSPTMGQPDKSIEPKATPTMNTIHIRILRRTHDQNDWAPLDDNDNEIQEVPVRDDETPETTDCVEFLRDTLEKYRIHPGDAVMVQRMNADEITEYVPTIRYTRTLDWWHGRQVIEAADDLGRQYVGTRGGRRATGSIPARPHRRTANRRLLQRRGVPQHHPDRRTGRHPVHDHRSTDRDWRDPDCRQIRRGYTEVRLPARTRRHDPKEVETIPYSETTPEET